MRSFRAIEALLLGCLAVLLFSFTLPATRAAVPVFGSTIVGPGRSLVGGLVAGLFLLVKREPLPARRYWGRLALVSCGVALGFPLLISLALEHTTSGHSAVIVGLLPASTAVLSVLLAGERPSLGFWLAAGAGLLAVLGFAVLQGAGRPQPADILVLSAVALGALGYAEGGALARELSGWRVISWALVLALPVLLPVVGFGLLHAGARPTPGAWLGFIYVALVSSYLGFFPWYRALSLGGVARISQIQLAQPILTLVWSALLLGERIDGGTIVAAALVLLSVAAGQRMRVRHVGPAPAVRGGYPAREEEPAMAG